MPKKSPKPNKSTKAKKTDALDPKKIEARRSRRNKSKRVVRAPNFLSKQIKTWLLPIVVLAFVLVVGFLVVKPWLDDFFDKRALVDSRETTLSQLMPKLELLSQQDEETLKDYLLKLEFALPGSISPAYVMASVEGALVEQGLAVDSLQFSGISNLTQQDIVNVETIDGNAPPAVPTPQVSELSEDAESVAQAGDIEMQISASGEYYQIVNFLKRLQELNPLVVETEFSIIKLDVEAVSYDEGEGRVVTTDLVLSAKSPFQTIPSDLGSVNQEVQVLSQDQLELIQDISSFESILQISDKDDGLKFEQGKEIPFSE